MKNCKKCGAEIAKSAKVCPKCGARFGLPGFVKALIIIFVILACIIGCVASCTKGVGDAIDESVKETENSYKDVNGKTSFKVNETFENKYLKITMAEVNKDFKEYSEYSNPKSGNKVLMVKINAENIGSDDQFVDTTDFDCYADDTAVERFYGYDDDKYQELSSSLSKGKKATGYLFFEVPANAKKIVLEYEPSWLDNNKIEFVIAE